MIVEDMNNGWIYTIEQMGSMVTEGLMTKPDYNNMILANVQNRLALVRESKCITGFTHVSTGHNWRMAFGGHVSKSKISKTRIEDVLSKILNM